MENQYEIMSPVGSFESLAAAIEAGAGSVYFGAGNLNMRAASSNNFSLEDIREIVNICNSHGIKSYLTVNTVIYDEETEKVSEILDVAKNSGVSAIIASDIAVMSAARSRGLEIHASTQLNVSNYEAVKFYAQFADVIVLARELNLKQVKRITDRIKEENLCGPGGKLLRIEIFVHGALCMAVSGKCYLSLQEANRSANRGACIQICRRAYTVTDNETGRQLEIDNKYIMSPKDLCTIGFLDKILDAGVSLLKIEGRGRGADYVKTVTEVYHDAVNAYIEQNYTQEKIDLWTSRLREVFNRDFWDGYYLGQTLGEWSKRYGSQATKRKILIGKITTYYKQIQVAAIKTEAEVLKKGDRLMIIGPTSGVVEFSADDIRVEDKSVDFVAQGIECSVSCSSVVRHNDKVFKIVDAE